MTGDVSITLVPPVDASRLGDCALWTATATAGKWSGVGKSYHAPTAVVIALQALTDALRADFPRAHGWRAPTKKTRNERRVRFSDTCGASGYMSKLGRTGANRHPDRCVCQGRETTPHKHYDDPPYNCARCGDCAGYVPAVDDPGAP